MKTTYFANFANDYTVTRKSDRTYTHAYLVRANDDRDQKVVGFAASEKLADKAARASMRYWSKATYEVVAVATYCPNMAAVMKF